jgi:hypothetical protein
VHMGSLQEFITQRRRDGVKTKTLNLALGVVRRVLNLAACEWMNACYVDSNIASTPTGAGFARRPVRGSSGPARPSQWPHHDALLPSGTDGPHRGRGEGVGDRAPQPPGFDAKSVNRWSAKWLIKRSYYGAPGEIRTPGLLVRSQALYPTELRAQRRSNAALRQPRTSRDPDVWQLSGARQGREYYHNKRRSPLHHEGGRVSLSIDFEHISMFN